MIAWHGSMIAATLLGAEIPLRDATHAAGITAILWCPTNSAREELNATAGELAGLWRSLRCSVPIVMLALDEARAAIRSSLVDSNSPGLFMVPLPCPYAEAKAILEQPPKISVSTARLLVKQFSGLELVWSKLGHDIAAAAIAGDAGLVRLMCQLKDEIEAHEPSALPLFAELEKCAGTDAFGGRLGALQDFLLRLRRNEEVPSAPHRRPPLGWDAVAIADNEGYDVDVISSLRRRGYSVCVPVAESVASATMMLDRFKPNVFLCDLAIPTPQDGLELMTLASERPWIKQIIAVSKGRIPTGLLPDSVEDCSGGSDWNDAEKIHNLIWRRALEQGVKEPVNR